MLWQIGTWQRGQNGAASAFASKGRDYSACGHVTTAEKQLNEWLQEKYGFKAVEFFAKGFANKEEYRKVHGSDLFLVDLEEYDRICKVMHFPGFPAVFPAALYTAVRALTIQIGTGSQVSARY